MIETVVSFIITLILLSILTGILISVESWILKIEIHKVFDPLVFDCLIFLNKSVLILVLLILLYFLVEIIVYLITEK